ncbi:carboxymuconolactone decarboxylase family protein [Alteromonas sp. C1M14]|uniref:carboxymuconolactone decarboxylase family protein n=1 Tax=Alteromonas sp. C1M14 TaxID=2841567 RepID=UPI001C08CCB0|nr:carboxymuconolactone decarboxylase family protein [Alteromonas sp. C1M14]MBU2978821.1 carboxymuconolactone decarboxylase family protein [Alteromonas sp. C1M14]
MVQSRFEAGLALLNQIDGEAGHNVIQSLQDICPDLAKFTIEYPFGDIYAREGLDLKSREIATVAALTALGHCAPQLKVHLNAALNVGCTEDEIKEVILQMSVYAGFPAALNGMFCFKDVLVARNASQNDQCT